MPKSLRALVMLLLFPVSGLAIAQSHFLPTGDAALRADVDLLSREGVIGIPVNTWPIPAGDVRDAVGKVQVDTIAEPALQFALLRVREKLAASQRQADWGLREVRASGGRPGLLRAYDTLAREEFELQSIGGVVTDRWSLELGATAVSSPEDGRHVRLDGSYLSVRLGNWLVSASQMSRWWGPGWDGGLILSTNARPMPALSLDRIHSEPFAFPVLRWFGPWRFNAFLARAEKYRPDVDESLFMGMRVAFKPVPILEVGLSRTAQFCGRGRPCDLETFRNVLFANDNVGLRVDPEDEPGNQMAGWDLRLVSPFRSLPVALYGEYIGEDFRDRGVPTRYLLLAGIEGWKLLDSGSSLGARVEYANTTCNFDRSPNGPDGNPDCAYRQAIFFAGYRYHGRTIGHTTDSDSESWSVSINLARPDESTWTAKVRRARLDRAGPPEPYNRVTQGYGRSDSIELGWKGRLWSQSLGLQVGIERNDRGQGSASSRAFGFLEWRKAL